MKISRTVTLDDDATLVRIRNADAEAFPGDIEQLMGLWERAGHESIRALPVRPVRLNRATPHVELNPRGLVVTRSGRVIGAGVAMPVASGDAELALLVDPEWREHGVELHLARALLEVARDENAPGGPVRRLTTEDRTIAIALGAFRELGDGRFQRWLRPWLDWGTTGTRPGDTLVIVHKGGAPHDPTAEDVTAALKYADGVEWDVVVTNDPDPLTAFHPRDPAGLDLRLGRRALNTLSRSEIGRIIGVTPLSFAQMLELTAGRPKDIEFKDPAAVEPAVRRLIHDDVPSDEVIATSFLPQAVRAASELGLRTGLLVGRRGFRASDFAPQQLLDETHADFVAPHRRLRRMGVLSRSGDRPALVWTVNRERDIIAALRDPRVHALITDNPLLAVQLRARLAQRQDRT
jgi:glycerophosphoryl diester phosphodiesterase/GNAT superfamily N-acetyltransferase